MKRYIIASLVSISLLTAFLSMTAKTGSDDQAKKVIEDISEGYTPFYTPPWAPKTTLAEAMLFTLQALLGASIFGYALSKLRTQRSGQEAGK